ncbi:uncharacterized protein [Bemisia tabaci]|uniref:uncharacterized protein n=1 Tax=Bemisia tabaci TaxID=7038 RepID=UPI003B281342
MKICTFCAAFVLMIQFVRIFVEAAYGKEDYYRDRAIQAYRRRETDRCREITPTSGAEARQAADSYCEQAFKALDAIEGNDCPLWKAPGCRNRLPGSRFFQCSCEVSRTCYVRTYKPQFKTFRECARGVKAEELVIGESIKPLRSLANNRSYDRPRRPPRVPEDDEDETPPSPKRRRRGG